MTVDSALIRSENTAVATAKLRLLTLNHLDNRTIAARKCRELIAALEAEAGGAAALTVSAREAIKRAAVLATVAEDIETRLLAGQEADPLVLATLNNAARRCLEMAGLRHTAPSAVFDEDTLIAAASGKAA
jgi:hypothetical protein